MGDEETLKSSVHYDIELSDSGFVGLDCAKILCPVFYSRCTYASK